MLQLNFDPANCTVCETQDCPVKCQYLHLDEDKAKTEMNPWTCALSGEDALRKPDSVGKPCSNVDARIWDDDCQDVPPGEVGEIVYSRPSVMKGYYKSPEDTREAMKGGYFHSGDLVREDKEGYVYVVDRKKDMIISGGENIYPIEIEEVLLRHSEIQQAAAIGVPAPMRGESVKGLLILEPIETAAEKEIRDYCRDTIAHHKAPKSVDFSNELPLGSTGKVLKRELREEYSKGGKELPNG